MDLEKVYQECANEQVRNFYNLHIEIFKSLAMDLNDLKQEILVKIWEILETNKGRDFEKGIHNYVGASVSNHLRSYITKAIVNYEDISLSDFGLKGLNQTDEEILESLYLQFKQDNPKNADLNYNILYKKLFIGKTEDQIVEDLIKEGIVESITRHRVSDIFWKRIVRKYRTKGRGLKTPPSQMDIVFDDGGTTDDSNNKNQFNKEYSDTLVENHASFLFDDIKPLLSEREYEIIEKHFKKGMNFQQIADELSIRKQTVYIFYTRALAKLRKIVPAEV